MKLLDAATLDLHEARGAAYLAAISEGYGRVQQFAYPNYRRDPRPRVLVLGRWRHQTSGNDLIAGINLNYLNQEQVQQLQQVLPQLLRSRNLQQRYWAGRRLLPQIFTNFYRTYRSDYIDAVTPSTLRFGQTAAAQQATAAQDTNRQANLAQAAALLQKQRERADQAQAAQQTQLPGPDAGQFQDTLRALQAQVAQQQQQHQELEPQEREPQAQQVPQQLPDVLPQLGATPGDQSELDALAGEPPPEELEQEQDLPVEPEPEETLEGAEQVPQPDKLKNQLGAECRIGPSGLLWRSSSDYVKWHDPQRVLTIHPGTRRSLLEAGRGPVLAVYDVISGRTVVDRAQTHAALLFEAGWDYDHTVRLMRCDGATVALANDLPVGLRGRLVAEALRKSQCCHLLTEIHSGIQSED